MMVQGNEQVNYEQFCEKVIVRAKEHERLNLPRTIALKADYSINYWVDFFTLLYNKHIVFPYLGQTPTYPWLEGVYANGSIIIIKDLERYEELDAFASTQQAGLVLETSGTSGNKKVVLHNFNIIAQKYTKLHRKFKTVLVFSPEHISGIETLLSIIIPGGTIIIPTDQSINTICTTIAAEKIDLLACTPSFIRLVMVSGNIEKLKSIQILNLGGERSDEKLLYKLQECLPHTHIHQAFGTTETTNIRTYSQEGSIYFKPGKEGEDYMIKEDILWLKTTPSIICFIIGKPIIENGWICTNDRVEQDNEGYIKILGRKEDTINIGGEKVDPAEVENTIIKMGGIISVKVYGEEDMIMGKKLVAHIYIEKGQTLTKQAIVQFCKILLPDYKIPVKFHIRTDLALTSRLKITHT